MTSKRRSQQDVEELDTRSISAEHDDEIVEFDPASPADTGTLAVQSASADASSLVPGDDLLRARDAVEARLGGFGAIATAFGSGVGTDGLGADNIRGIGVGLKLVAGTYTGEMVVKVFVKEKAPVSRLVASSTVPSEIDGIPTDVEEIGELFAQSYHNRFPRPVPCGVSCGHFKITAGTIGALVVLNNNRLAILSNNHVLANENHAQPGDAILQPGRVDGGQNPADLIGVLQHFVPINFPGPNLVDAATAWTAFSLVRPDHVTYRLNPSPLAPSLSLSVMKNGRTTQATQGVVIGVAVNNVAVQYTSGVAVFNDQVIIRGIGPAPFSQGGDSGSVIVSTGTRQPIGLLFAGSATHTIANPIGAVISALGISRFL